MKKIIASVAAVMCALSMTASATVMEFKMNNTQLNVQADDGTITSQTLEAAPYTVNDRTVVPVRVISESFGADVAWNDETETVTITKGDTVINLTIGKTTATVNGSEVTLDVAPFTENGRTLVPVRFVTEGLGYDVTYEEYLESVLITDEAPAMTIGGTPVSRATYKMLFDEASGSGMYESAEAVKAPVEDVLVNIYAISGNQALTDEVRELLEYNLDYAYYSEYVDVLETTYTQLMIKNIQANMFYQQLSDSVIVETDDAATQEYFEENYVTAKHILIPVMDLETGVPYDEKQADEAKKLANDIKKRLDKGEDFDKLMNEYSKDTGLEYYPDGYTFTYGEMVPEFEETSFALKEGKISDPVESYYGYHIIKREPLGELTPDIKETIDMTRTQTMVDAMVNEAISSAEVVANDEVINSILGN